MTSYVLQYPGYEAGDPLNWKPPRNVPTCVVSHLKVIEFFYFEGDKAELKMLVYFLKNGKVFEKHFENIAHRVEEKELVAIVEELKELPVGSKICEFEMPGL